jgi:hypothetical protein
MEPIPVFFENVNRTALVIKPNKPYFDWLKSIEDLPDDPDIYSHNDIYLLPDLEDTDQMQKWIKKNSDIIFCDCMVTVLKYAQMLTRSVVVSYLTCYNCR